MSLRSARIRPGFLCSAAGFFLVILLAGCTALPPSDDPAPAQGSDASLARHLEAVSGSGDTTEGELPAEEAEEVEALAMSGTMLPERLLPSGVLEIGHSDAPHTLLLITDHRCGYCIEFQTEHVPRLREEFLIPGSLKWHVVILPLQKNPGSTDAAAALLCAATEGRGLAMHALLHERTAYDASSLLSYAREIGLSENAFATCIESEGTHAMLRTQQAWLESLHVTLVPTLYLNGQRAVGLPYWADLRGWIESVMEK